MKLQEKWFLIKTFPNINWYIPIASSYEERDEILDGEVVSPINDCIDCLVYIYIWGYKKKYDFFVWCFTFALDSFELVHSTFVVESWTENPEFVKYVTELTSYGTDRLCKYLFSPIKAGGIVGYFVMLYI